MTFKQGLYKILILTLLISGSAALICLYTMYARYMRMKDSKYHIAAIVQTGPEKEELKSLYLAELLQLSIDKPTNLYLFNTKEAEKLLLKSPLIKEATVKKLPPAAIYIDYTVRQPIAFLGDFTNTAIDSDGVLLPFKPFFTPKRLPEIYLGLDQATVTWGQPISDERAELALKLLKLINERCCSKISHLRRIDLSNVDADSYGQKQIVVILEDILEKEGSGKTMLSIEPRILRLSTTDYEQGIEAYLAMRNYLLTQRKQQPATAVVRAEAMIVDLRIPRLGLIPAK
jgi:hypothetical protein